MKYTIQSSWKVDRFASAFLSKKKAVRVTRGRRLIARYVGNEVKVLGLRGKCHVTLTFDAKVMSAIVKDERLFVRTADESYYTYVALTGKLLSEWHPDSPASAHFILAA